MAQWFKVAKKSDIPAGSGLLVDVNGQEVALFNVGGKVQAMYAVCPHQGGPLHEGGLDGKIVTCPWHGWEFDVTNGVCTFNDSITNPVFKVKEEGEDILVEG